MNATTFSQITLPNARVERLALPAALLLEPRRFIDGSVREIPEAEDTTS